MLYPRFSCYHRWQPTIDLIVRGKYSIPTVEANGDREFAESQMEEAGALHFLVLFSSGEAHFAF